jgi:acyl-coenzyme A thioesterase PaaI-like protein
MGLAAHSMVEAGEFCPSIETSVKFLDKICADDQTLTITADVIEQEGRKFLIEGAIQTQDGKKLATGKSTCILITPK